MEESETAEHYINQLHLVQAHSSGAALVQVERWHMQAQLDTFSPNHTDFPLGVIEGHSHLLIGLM